MSESKDKEYKDAIRKLVYNPKYLRQNRFKAAARRAAEKSTVRFQLGCVIACKNNIIAAGYNKIKTHPKSRQIYKFLHAEEDALIRAGRRAKGADIYVVRLTAKGFGLSRPCDVCLSLLREAEIRRVFYTDKEGYLQKQNIKDILEYA